MILLYNVYLDDKIRIPGFFYRGNYGNNTNSIDVFKYALSSVVDIYPWTRVIINVELNPTLSHREEELNNYIKDLFKNYDLILTNKRCERQSEWKQLYEQLNDEIIYFCCNHDHVFIDKDPKDFIKDIESFREYFSDNEASFYFSHWQEILNLFIQNKQNTDSEYISNNSYALSDRFIILLDNNIDSIQIITKKLYHTWWFTGEFEDMVLPRTDYANFNGCVFPNQPIKFQVAPYKEYFRHFDGYSHFADPSYKPIISNLVCPLFIPSGFFENDIKLKIGYDVNDTNYININLSKNNYTVADDQGTDMKCFIEEIPYFWKNKISQVDSNPEYKELDFISQRNSNIIDPLVCGLFHGKIKDQFVIDKIKQANNINNE